MAVIARDTGGGGNFILAPEGLHICVCCDVYPLGLITTEWNGKKRTTPKIRIAWQTEDTITDEEAAENGNPDIAGKPYLLTKRYTLSLHENADLRKDLQRWRGKAFTPDELHGFDVERLVGVPCQINVIHNRGSNDRVYANVDGIMRAPAGTLINVRDYTRKKDRDDWEEPNMDMPGREPSNADATTDDDDIPF